MSDERHPAHVLGEVDLPAGYSPPSAAIGAPDPRFQLVIRVDPDLLAELEHHSARYHRTTAQTVRFWLRAMARAATLDENRAAGASVGDTEP